MEKVIGGVLGLAAGAAVVGVSLTNGVSVWGCLWRAAVAVLLGYWIGRLVFGKAGLAIVKEAAGSVPPRRAQSAAETKPPPGPPDLPPPKAS